MSGFLTAAYPWTKALHIIAVIAWMAGLFYLPRLFVYHSGVEPGSAQSETFKVMERRLLRAIMNPAMIAAYIFGLAVLSTPGIVDWDAGWIYMKLVLVAILSWHHHRQASWMKDFAADRNRQPARFYRMQNEVPTLLMIGIVILVVVRPF
ncbi:membrane protein [Allostella vacuolata]|nr:membrane protein [Stella vacuolata]